MAKMKPGFLYAIIGVAAIAIVASFNMQLADTTGPEIAPAVADNVLYVCPAASTTWDAIAAVFGPLINYVLAGFFFVIVLLAFGWGWYLYQNLLSDKFKRDDFKTIWGLTKFAFWAAIVVVILIATPNSFRSIERTGFDDKWVLCEANTPGSQPVYANTVHAR